MIPNSSILRRHLNKPKLPTDFDLFVKALQADRSRPDTLKDLKPLYISKTHLKP